MVQEPSKITPAKSHKQCGEGGLMVRWYGNSRLASETSQKRKTCFLVAQDKGNGPVTKNRDQNWWSGELARS